MKLLEFKLIKDKSLTEDECRSDMGKTVECILLEDQEHHWYDDYIVDNCEMFWNGYMTAKLGYYTSDNDIFYYFYPEDQVPEVGKKWEQDELVFERVA